MSKKSKKNKTVRMNNVSASKVSSKSNVQTKNVSLPSEMKNAPHSPLDMVTKPVESPAIKGLAANFNNILSNLMEQVEELSKKGSKIDHLESMVVDNIIAIKGKENQMMMLEQLVRRMERDNKASLEGRPVNDIHEIRQDNAVRALYDRIVKLEKAGTNGVEKALNKRIDELTEESDTRDYKILGQIAELNDKFAKIAKAEKLQDERLTNHITQILDLQMKEIQQDKRLDKLTNTVNNKVLGQIEGIKDELRVNREINAEKEDRDYNQTLRIYDNATKNEEQDSKLKELNDKADRKDTLDTAQSKEIAELKMRVEALERVVSRKPDMSGVRDMQEVNARQDEALKQLSKDMEALKRGLTPSGLKDAPASADPRIAKLAENLEVVQGNLFLMQKKIERFIHYVEDNIYTL